MSANRPSRACTTSTRPQTFLTARNVWGLVLVVQVREGRFALSQCGVLLRVVIQGVFQIFQTVFGQPALKRLADGFPLLFASFFQVETIAALPFSAFAMANSRLSASGLCDACRRRVSGCVLSFDLNGPVNAHGEGVGESNAQICTRIQTA